MGSQIVVNKTSYDRLKNKLSKLTYSCDHLTIVQKGYLSQLDQNDKMSNLYYSYGHLTVVQKD